MLDSLVTGFFGQIVRRLNRGNCIVATLLIEVTPGHLNLPIATVLAYLALC